MLVALLALPAALGACTTIEGAPRRVIDVQQSVALTNDYRMDVAIQRFHSGNDSDRHNMSPEQYRNMVIAVYVNAIDARYYDFRSRISSERRELDSGIDIGVLALTNAITAAATHHARDLAAIASTFGGAGAALDRNLFFDRALPALLAAMDTQRLRVLTRIQQNLGDDAAQYPLEVAFADLNRYEMAGSLDAAIGQVTAQAAAAQQEAQRRYDAAVHACTATEDLTANNVIITDWLLADDRTLPELRGLAGLMNVEIESDAAAADVIDRIDTALATNYCANSSLESLIARARQTDWGDEM